MIRHCEVIIIWLDQSILKQNIQIASTGNDIAFLSGTLNLFKVDKSKQ